MNAKTADKTVPSDRAIAQRDRILCAAKQCFVEHGFHQASMNNIADAAGISAGLIYRYFDSKNAIILAIIERQLAEKRADIASLQPAVDFAQRVVELVAKWRDGDPKAMNPTLFLEMSALGPRDPKIAQALREADQVSRADFGAWLAQRAAGSGKQLAPDEAAVRAFALQCLIEGMAVRSVREPGMAPELVAGALALALPCLLPE
jgi:AcrR family transcriptional regulator